jgi:hypothetical protein
LPSTIDARKSIGAFAAITTWLHDSSWLRFIEIASRRSARHGVPSMRWKRHAFAIARGRLVIAFVSTSRSTKACAARGAGARRPAS